MTDELPPQIGPKLYGRFFYSKRQRRELDSKGADRTFARLIPSGEVVEYTEMVDAEKVALGKVFPNDEGAQFDAKCLYEDAEFLGDGFYLRRKSIAPVD